MRNIEQLVEATRPRGGRPSSSISAAFSAGVAATGGAGDGRGSARPLRGGGRGPPAAGSERARISRRPAAIGDARGRGPVVLRKRRRRETVRRAPGAHARLIWALHWTVGRRVRNGHGAGPGWPRGRQSGTGSATSSASRRSRSMVGTSGRGGQHCRGRAANPSYRDTLLPDHEIMVGGWGVARRATQRGVTCSTGRTTRPAPGAWD